MTPNMHYLSPKVVRSFNHVHEVVPTAQEPVSHTGLFHTFLVIK